MREISKKRERQIKLTIIGISVFLLVLIVAILFWTGTVQFDWSNKMIRDHQYEANRDKEKRVLIIGDSQLEKWIKIDCLYKMMEDYTSENNVGYINAAHHGFGPIEYLDRIQLVAPDYKPDLIVLFYYVGNDLTDVMLREDDTPKKPKYEYSQTIKDMDEFNRIRRSDEEIKQQKEEIDNSSQFDWEGYREIGIDPVMIEYAKNRLLNPYEFGPEYVNPHILNMAKWNNTYLLDNSMINSVASKSAWFKVLKKFEDILLITEKLGSQLCIVAIPSTVQVDESHFDFYKKNTFKVPKELTSSNQAQLLLKEFSIASGITYIDLLPYFKKHKRTQDLYFENDDHLSELGHRYAFDKVKKEILEPFIIGSFQQSTEDREKNYYKNYISWAINQKMQIIKSDSVWLDNIKKKALTEAISVDSMLFLDAKYLIEMESN